MRIKLGRHSDTSFAERDVLTHTAAELGVVINATVTPRPGAGDQHPVAHIHIHYGDKRGGLGMTTTDAEQLIDAGMALIQAGQMLRKDQAAFADKQEVAV